MTYYGKQNGQPIEITREQYLMAQDQGIPVWSEENKVKKAPTPKKKDDTVSDRIAAGQAEQDAYDRTNDPINRALGPVPPGLQTAGKIMGNLGTKIVKPVDYFMSKVERMPEILQRKLDGLFGMTEKRKQWNN